MVEPLYVPVLPIRRGAVTAFERLHPDIRQRIAPLWTLTPRVGPERTRGAPMIPDPDTDERALSHWLNRRTNHLIKAMDTMAGWVDTTHIETVTAACAVSLWRLMTRSCLKPVTGPERARRHQRYAADLAFLAGRGLGIRVLLDELPEAPLSTELLKLVDEVRMPPSHLDLLLDAGSVYDVAEAGKRAVVALDLLASLVPWRTVVLVAGAFPRTAETTYETRATSLATRHDWHLRDWVCAARPGQAAVYGDYSVEHVLSANIPADRSGHGPPWGLFRYTGPDRFLIARAPTRGADRADRVRAMARWIVENEAFRSGPSLDRSAAEAWLESCAYGTGPDGSGNAETWIRTGHIQHLTYVTRCLMDHRRT